MNDLPEIPNNDENALKNIETNFLNSQNNLDEEEKKLVESLKEKIELNDNNSIIQYGSSAQLKISKFSDNILQNVKTKDTEDIGKDLFELVDIIGDFDPEKQKKSRLPFGIGKSIKKQFDRLSANYDTVSDSIDKVTSSLEAHQRQLLKDIHMLDAMYGTNYEYFKELSLYIVAGEERLISFINIDIENQRKIAEETKDQMEAQKLNDMINQSKRFEKKLHDLKLSRTISIQMAPQIRLIQNNNTVLVEKIQSSIVNSIPLWKNQIVIALGIANSQSALSTQKKVSDMTNELLSKNSEMLKQGSLEVAKESERSIVSVETLRKTNADLIETINGVLEIQKKGSEERAVAEQELQKIETELKDALLEAGKNKDM